MMPFTHEQFLEVFADYNRAVFPMQFLLIAAAIVAVLFAFGKSIYSGKIIAGTLASLWLWMGAAYHLLFFSEINDAAFIFGAFFILQAVMFFNFGFSKDKLSFGFRFAARGITGLFIMFYALILYPLPALFFGQSYPYSPTFGLPCPTAIFTFGMLLWSDRKIPWYLLAVPFVWSLIGTSAAFLFGIYEDLALFPAALIASAILMQNRWEKRSLS